MLRNTHLNCVYLSTLNMDRSHLWGLPQPLPDYYTVCSGSSQQDVLEFSVIVPTVQSETKLNLAQRSKWSDGNTKNVLGYTLRFLATGLRSFRIRILKYDFLHRKTLDKAWKQMKMYENARKMVFLCRNTKTPRPYGLRSLFDVSESHC